MANQDEHITIHVDEEGTERVGSPLANSTMIGNPAGAGPEVCRLCGVAYHSFCEGCGLYHCEGRHIAPQKELSYSVDDLSQAFSRALSRFIKPPSDPPYQRYNNKKPGVAPEAAHISSLAQNKSMTMDEYETAVRRAESAGYISEEQKARVMTMNDVVSNYQPDYGLKDVLLATAKGTASALGKVEELGEDLDMNTTRVRELFLEDQALSKVAEMLDSATKRHDSKLISESIGLSSANGRELVPPPILGNNVVDKKTKENWGIMVRGLGKNIGGAVFKRFLQRAREFLQTEKVSPSGAYTLMKDALESQPAMLTQVELYEQDDTDFHQIWVALQASFSTTDDESIAEERIKEMLQNPPDDVNEVASIIERNSVLMNSTVEDRALRNRMVEREMTKIVTKYVNMYMIGQTDALKQVIEKLKQNQKEHQEYCARTGQNAEATRIKWKGPGWGLTQWLRERKEYVKPHTMVPRKDQNLPARAHIGEVGTASVAPQEDATTREVKALRAEISEVKQELGKAVQRANDNLNKPYVGGNNRSNNRGNNRGNDRGNNRGRPKNVFSEVVAESKSRAANSGSEIEGLKRQVQRLTDNLSAALNSQNRNQRPGDGRGNQGQFAGGNGFASGNGAPMRGACFLCKRENHWANACRTYPGERPGPNTCQTCGGRHTSPCKQRVRGNAGGGQQQQQQQQRSVFSAAPNQRSGRNGQNDRGGRD